jgi:hypothetical protein
MTHCLNDTAPLLAPDRLWTVGEISADPTVVPNLPGIYGWWFTMTDLSGVPIDGTLQHDSRRLLYVGIAPRQPPGAGGSKRTLRDRLKNHCRGPLSSSTLRRTLTSLLAVDLGLKTSLRESGKLNLARTDEERLTSWMEANARVSWLIHEEPWHLEETLISSGQPLLPFNLRGSTHPFRPVLSTKRRNLGE